MFVAYKFSLSVNTKLVAFNRSSVVVKAFFLVENLILGIEISKKKKRKKNEKMKKRK